MAPRDPDAPDLPEGEETGWEKTLARDVVIGKTIGEYVVRQRVGSGGMGVVYEGEQPLIGRRVAIKILRGDVDHEQDLLDEARVVNQIRHRGIVDIYGFGELPGIGQYLVMEFLDGKPLDRVMEKEGPLGAADAIAILDQILEPLEAAHARGVVHRDLKPSNVFLVDQPGGRYVKLLDFGLAKRMSKTGAAHQTRVTNIVGTPFYMAPELAKDQTVGPKTDLYAVGVLAFELLTGRVPFEGTQALEVVSRHVHEPPPRPSTIVPVPPALEELVLALLAKKPEQRPTSAQVVRHSLKRILRELADAATRLGPAPKTRASSTAIPVVTTPVGAPPAAKASPALQDSRVSEAPTPLDGVEALPPKVDTQRVVVPEGDAAASAVARGERRAGGGENDAAVTGPARTDRQRASGEDDAPVQGAARTERRAGGGEVDAAFPGPARADRQRAGVAVNDGAAQSTPRSKPVLATQRLDRPPVPPPVETSEAGPESPHPDHRGSRSWLLPVGVVCALAAIFTIAAWAGNVGPFAPELVAPPPEPLPIAPRPDVRPPLWIARSAQADEPVEVVAPPEDTPAVFAAAIADGGAGVGAIDGGAAGADAGHADGGGVDGGGANGGAANAASGADGGWATGANGSGMAIGSPGADAGGADGGAPTGEAGASSGDGLIDQITALSPAEADDGDLPGEDSDDARTAASETSSKRSTRHRSVRHARGESTGLGTLIVGVTGGRVAEVFVDGKSVGVTPFRGELPSGTHRVRVQVKGASPYVKRVRVRAHGSAKLLTHWNAELGRLE